MPSNDTSEQQVRSLTPRVLGDRFIDLDFYGDNAHPVLSIITPRTGLKPTISLDVNLIPGESCYKCVIRIVNFNTTLNLRTLTYVRVTAGYLHDYSSITLFCPIFSAYQESPNPDGVTVINCLCVGQLSGFLEPRLIPVRIYDSPISWRRLITAVFEKTGATGIDDIDYTMPAEILDYSFKSTMLSNCYADSGYALITWLGRELREFGKKQNPPHNIVTQVYNKHVSIIDTTMCGAPSDNELIIDLSMVSSASFTGAKLDVVAPWNPDLVPGTVFRMPASYYSAELTYNDIAESNYLGRANLYRALTVNVSFNTVETTNQMTILAIPIQYLRNQLDAAMSDASGNTIDFTQTIDEGISQVGSIAQQGKWKEVADPLIIGIRKVAERANQTFWEASFQAPFKTESFGKYTQTPSIYTWSDVAAATYKDRTLSAEEREQLRTILVRAGYSITSVAATIPGSYYWPLIVYSTYHNWSNADDVNAVIDFAYPGQLQYYATNTLINIPTTTTGCKSVMEEYYKYAKANKLQGDISMYLYIAYLEELV